MTVTYNPKIATIKNWVTLRILMRWKGSLYKLVLPDMAMFCGIYVSLSLVYRLALNDAQRETFRIVCLYFREYSGMNTVTFCLGFYCAYVLNRWWEFFKTLPWMFTPGYHIRQAIIPPCVISRNLKNATGEEQRGNQETNNNNAKSNLTDVPEEDENKNEEYVSEIKKQFDEALQIRKDLVRYVLVGWIWMLRRISKPILLRFKPTENLSDSSLIDKLRVMNTDPFVQKYFPELLTEEEMEGIIAYAKAQCGENFDKYELDHFIPMGWATDLVYEARRKGFVATDYHANDLLRTLRDFRAGLGILKLMDLFNVPLVYTQVVALCLYIYFILNCFATQFIDQNKPDFYVPLPFMLQLAFLFGWLRVSEVCLNPFGEDDDDFPTWQILNMNLDTAYKIVNVYDLDLVKDMCGSSRRPKTSNATQKKLSNADRLSIPRPDRRRQSTVSSRSCADNQHPPSPSVYVTADSGLPGVSESTDTVQDGERSVLMDRTVDDYHLANYERLKRMYDRPLFQGSALESELCAKRKTSASVGRTQPSLGLKKPSSVLLMNLDGSKTNLTSGSKSGSKTLVTSSKSNLASSKSTLNINGPDDTRTPLTAVLNVEEVDV